MWLAAALALLAFPVRFYSKPVGRATLVMPRTPLDRVQPENAAMWSFLLRAAPHVPAGSTFTVRATSRELEMDLYMLAHGPIRHATPMPSSYYGRSLAHIGARAEFVLSYRTLSPEEEDVETNATWDDGQLLRRRPPS